MKTSRIFYNKTISFAKNSSNKTTMLVYDRPLKPLSPKDLCNKPKIATVPTKKIKVCTGAEMKKMCRPKPCECPPVPTETQSIVYAVINLIKLFAKSLIAGSVIYWTYDAGIWGDSEHTEEFYTYLCHSLNAHEDKEENYSKSCKAELELRKMNPTPPPPDECSKPPVDCCKTIYYIKETWNHTITFIFEGVTKFPTNIMRWYEEKYGKAPVCIPVKTK